MALPGCFPLVSLSGGCLSMQDDNSQFVSRQWPIHDSCIETANGHQQVIGIANRCVLSYVILLFPSPSNNPFTNSSY